MRYTLLPMLIAISGCFSGERLAEVRFTIERKTRNIPFLQQFSQNASPPASIDSFSCLALNLTGGAITSTFPFEIGCNEIGVTSSIVDNENGASLTASVPTGDDVLVQVMGISDWDCDGELTLQKVLEDSRDLPSSDIKPFITEIGKTSIDVSSDIQVSIEGEYNQATAINLNTCSSGELPLVAVWKTNTTTDPFNFDVGPAHSGDAFSLDEVKQIADSDDETTFAMVSSNAASHYAIMDFIFDASSVALDQATQISYLVRGHGGLDQECMDAGDVESGPDIRARLYRAGTSGFEFVAESGQGNAAPQTFGTDVSSSDYEIQSFNATITGDTPDGTGPDYLAIRVHGPLSAGGDCSKILVSHAQITVE